MKKIWLVPIALVLIVIALVQIVAVVFSSRPTSLAEGIKYGGAFCVYKNNKLIECKENMITNRGKDLIKMDMMGTAVVTLDKLAIANNTVAQSPADTNLQGEWTTCGLARATGTLTSVGVGNWSISYQWTSTCNNAIVNATGIYNTTAPGNLFAQTTFATATLQTNDKINVTYYIWVQ